MDWHSRSDPAANQRLGAFFELVESATEGLVVSGHFVGEAGVEVTHVSRERHGRNRRYMPGGEEALLLLAVDGSELIRCQLEREYAHCVAINDVDPDGPLVSWNSYTGTFYGLVPLLPGATGVSIHLSGIERWRGVIPPGTT